LKWIPDRTRLGHSRLLQHERGSVRYQILTIYTHSENECPEVLIDGFKRCKKNVFL